MNMTHTLRPDMAPAKEQSTNSAYFAELDAIDRETARLNAESGCEDEWDRWEKWTTRVWQEIAALPPTRENAEIKARAAWSIIAGNFEDLNEGQSTCCRLVRHIISGLGTPPINPYPPTPPRAFFPGFNAEQWLASFEAVGGGWALVPHLQLMWQINGRPAEDQRIASDMVARLTFEDRKAIADHLSERRA